MSSPAEVEELARLPALFDSAKKFAYILGVGSFGHYTGERIPKHILGGPGTERFGLTIDASGQRVWLDRPEFLVERMG